MIKLNHQIQERCAVHRFIRTALLFLAATTAFAVQAEQHALLIGVSDYKDQRIPDLEGPVNDVQALTKVLVSQWNFKASNIRSLLNEQATEQNILQALDELLQSTQPDDNVLVYFSGHGTSARDPQLGALLNLPNGSGALVASDFNPELAARSTGGQSIKDGMLVGRHELRPRFEALNKQRAVLIIFDTCFSGNAARSRYSPGARHNVRNLKLATFRGKAMNNVQTKKPRLTTLGCSDCVENLSGEFNYSNLVYFGAAAEDQLAVDFSQAEIDAGVVTTHDGKPHGGFTDSLLRVLSNKQVNEVPLSYSKLFNLLLNEFNEHCSHCGHNPVLLPTLNEDTSALLQRPFVPNRTITAKPGKDVPKRTSTDEEKSSDAKLKVAFQTDSAENSEATMVLRNAIKPYATTSQTPDVNFSLQSQLLHAYTADGLLISAFEQDVSTTKLGKWLQARQWLKQRQHVDAQQNKGQLSVQFRHPLLGNRVNAGDHIFFNLQSTIDTSLAVLTLNSAGQLSVLYPTNEKEAKKVVSAGTQLRLPGKDEAAIEVIPPWGTDVVMFYAIPSKHQLLKILQKLSKQTSIELDDPALKTFESELNSGKVAYSSGFVQIVSTDSP